MHASEYFTLSFFNTKITLVIISQVTLKHLENIWRVTVDKKGKIFRWFFNQKCANLCLIHAKAIFPLFHILVVCTSSVARGALIAPSPRWPEAGFFFKQKEELHKSSNFWLKTSCIKNVLQQCSIQRELYFTSHMRF